NLKGIIVETHYTLANESTKHADMTLGIGILYQERTIRGNGAGRPVTTNIDNDHSSFSDLPKENLHRRSMFETTQKFVDARGIIVETSPEEAINRGDLFLRSDLTKFFANHITPWHGGILNVNFENDKSNILVGS